MKLKLIFEKGIGIVVERTPEEYKLMEQEQLFKQQIKIAELPTPKQGTGDTFTNCTITHGQPIIVPQPVMMQAQKQSIQNFNQEFIDKATDYTAMHTGQNSDTVAKVIEALLQYFKDRGVI